MKQHFTILILSLSLTCIVKAQTFQDDFESYTAGSKLVANSTVWKTWTQPYSASEDVTVTNTDALSGSQSLYFASTSGGPVDIILPFNSEYNTGTLDLQMNLKVNSGKQAYMNLQRNTTAGQFWALDITFKTNGTVEFANNGATLLVLNYPQNIWFNFNLVAKLNNSEWLVYIDANYEGTFQNPTYQIASLNIYPIQNSAFYVDDVSYEYTPSTPATLNASLAYLNVPAALAGQTISPVFTIRNLGTQVINTCKLSALYDGNIYAQTFNNLALAAGAETQITLNQNITLIPGTQNLSGAIEEVNGGNDDVAGDNVKQVMVNPIVPAPGKIVVAEEGTGTWCGWCPRGAVFMDYMEHTFGDYFAGIAVHNGDPMTVAEYDTPLSANFSGYPSALVDRGSAIDPSAIPSNFVTQIQVAPKAILLNGAQYDANTNTLKVSIKTTAVSAFSGNYKIACVLTENGVKGSGSGWAQANYYSGGNNGVMGGYELLPNPVPASQMVYNHVARAISPSFTGLPNAFGTASAGSEYIHNFSFTVPSNWKLDSLHIIGLFINAAGKIDNASKSTYQQAVANGFLPGVAVSASSHLQSVDDIRIRLFPNPAADMAVLQIPLDNISDVTVQWWRADGSLLISKTYESLQGIQQIPLNIQDLVPGCYFISVTTNTNHQAVKLIKK